MAQPYGVAESRRILERGLTYNGQTLTLVNVNDVEVDHVYQRNYRHSRAQAIAQNYKEKAIGLFRIAKRANGQLFCNDGQHRKGGIEIRQEMGLPVNPMVLALISVSRNREEESEDFVDHNTMFAVNGNDRFKARVVCKGKPEYKISKIVEKFGFFLTFNEAGRPSKYTTTLGIRGAAKLLKAYEKSPNIFERGIELLKKAYVKDGIPDYASLTGEFIGGLVKLLADQANNGRITETQLNKIAEELKNSPSAEVIRRIANENGGTKHSSQRAEVIAEVLKPYAKLPMKLVA